MRYAVAALLLAGCFDARPLGGDAGVSVDVGPPGLPGLDVGPRPETGKGTDAGVAPRLDAGGETDAGVRVARGGDLVEGVSFDAHAVLVDASRPAIGLPHDFTLHLADLPDGRSEATLSMYGVIGRGILDVGADGTRTGALGYRGDWHPTSCTVVTGRTYMALRLRVIDAGADGTWDRLEATAVADVTWVTADFGGEARYDVAIHGEPDVTRPSISPWERVASSTVSPGADVRWLATEPLAGTPALWLADGATRVPLEPLGPGAWHVTRPLPFGARLRIVSDPPAVDLAGHPLAGEAVATVPDPGRLDDGGFETGGARFTALGSATLVGAIGSVPAISGSRSLHVPVESIADGGHAILRVPIPPGATHLRIRARAVKPLPDASVWWPIRVWPVDGPPAVLMVPSAGATATGDGDWPYLGDVVELLHPLPAAPGAEVIVDIDQTAGPDPCGPRPLGYSAGVLVDDVAAVTR